MKQIILPLVLSFILGCSALGGAGLVSSALSGGGGPSLEVDATLGDKEEVIHTEVGTKVDNKKQEATVINNTVEEFDPTVLLVLVGIAILGWVLPTPTELWKKLPFGRRKK
jgi:hypothetical protein